MKIKRMVQGTALAALAAAAWMGAGSDASAAIQVSDISYFGDTILDVNSSDDDTLEIMVGIAKGADKDKAKVSAWDVYEGSDACVDLSKMNVTKDAYLAVKTDKDEIPVFVKIDAAPKTLKAELNSGTGEVVFKVNGTATTNVEAYGLGHFSQDNKGEKKFYINETLQYQGATKYWCVPGNEYDTTDKKNIKTIKDLTDDKKNGKDATLVTIGQFPSKQAKLSIPKQANGPAVNVDYVKGTVKVKAGVEVRTVGDSISGTTDNTAIVGKTVPVGDLFKPQVFKTEDGKSDITLPENATLEVRVAAKTDGKGKAASKWTRVAIQKPQEVTSDIDASGATSPSTKSAMKFKVSSSAVSEASIEVKYTADKKGVANGGLVIDNKAGYAIDYVISSTTPAPNDKGVVTGSKTIKAAKNATLKKLSDGNKIWIRISGDKTKKQWASAWKEFHTVAQPKAEQAK